MADLRKLRLLPAGSSLSAQEAERAPLIGQERRPGTHGGHPEAFTLPIGLNHGPRDRSVVSSLHCMNDPQCMVRPRVARELSSSWRMCGLASMYPAFDWSLLCSGPSWVSARVRSHYRKGLNGPSGSPVLACAGNSISFLILSQTSAGKAFQPFALKHAASILLTSKVHP
jgi:hypothetical protein